MSGRFARSILCVLGGLAAASQLNAFVAESEVWPNGTVTFTVRLGNPPSTLIDGSTTWSQVVTSGIAEWNPQINDIQLASVTGTAGDGGSTDGTNDIFFSATRYGESFGSSTLAIAVTQTVSINGGPFERIESDIIFNTAFTWNSYRGTTRSERDLRRVLIHEMGHSIGLKHPDEAGQTVSAIMNSITSNVDTVTADDIAGAQSLYGAGSGGGGGGGGGDTGDSFESDDVASSATPIANGATQTHSIHVVGDKDWVSFTIPSDSTNLTIQTAGASGDTEIFLFGPNQSTAFVTSNDDIDFDGGNRFSRIIRSAPIAGTYFVRVEEFSNNATISSYTINVSWSESSDAFEADNTAGAAVAISNGQTQNRAISPVGDLDWVTFTITEGDATDFVVETAGNTGDTVLTLFGPNSSTTVRASGDDIDEQGGNLFSRISLGTLAAGTYHVRVEEFNNNGTISAYTLRASWTQGSPPTSSSAAKLSNLSVRAKTGGQFGTLILGFATSGASKEVLIRGMGPTIGGFGVQNPIPDPRLDMIRNGAAIDEVDDWDDEPNAAAITTRGAQLGAFAPSSLLEAILLRSVEPSPYTVLVTDTQGRTGEVLIEAYDADALSAAGRLTNLSTRTEVGGAAGILTAGFVVAGTGELTLLIRGVGPTLTDFGVSGAVGDPTLVVISGTTQARVGNNDDWGSDNAGNIRTTASAVGAFALVEGSRDAALLITLPPGPYTVEMNSGSNGSPGNGLIEIYEVR